MPNWILLHSGTLFRSPFHDHDFIDSFNRGANTIALNSGQYCVAASRVYVQEAVYESFLAKYKAGLEQIARGTGDPCNKDTVYGPVADKLQFDRVSSYIEAGKKEATLFAGGKMDDGGKVSYRSSRPYARSISSLDRLIIRVGAFYNADSICRPETRCKDIQRGDIWPCLNCHEVQDRGGGGCTG